MREMIEVLEALIPCSRDARWYLASWLLLASSLFDFEGTVKACSMALALAGPDRSIAGRPCLGMAHGFMKYGSHAEAALCHRMLLDDDEPRDFGAAVGAAHASSWACDWAGLAEDFDRLAQCIQRVEATEARPCRGRQRLSSDHAYRRSRGAALGLAPDLPPADRPHGGGAASGGNEGAAPAGPGAHRPGVERFPQPCHRHPGRRMPRAIDRERFELWLYSAVRTTARPCARASMPAATAWCETADLTSGDLARRIRDDRIGVLIEMKGYTLGARMDVMAHRPAPVQVSPGWAIRAPRARRSSTISSAGSGGDAAGGPPDFTERIAQMPHCYQPNDSTRSRPEPPTRAQCGLPAEASFRVRQLQHALQDRAGGLRGLVPDPSGGAGSVLWLLVEHEPAVSVCAPRRRLAVWTRRGWSSRPSCVPICTAPACRWLICAWIPTLAAATPPPAMPCGPACRCWR